MNRKGSLASHVLIIVFLIVPWFMNGCNRNEVAFIQTKEPDSSIATEVPLEITISTSTEGVVTLTPNAMAGEPLALRINGVEVSRIEYEAILKQIREAVKDLGFNDSPEEQRKKALDTLIDQTLLAEAAILAGFDLSDSEVDSRIQNILTELGGDATGQAEWLKINGYTLESFRSERKRAWLAEWQTQKIWETVPKDAQNEDTLTEAVIDWIQAQRSKATIEIFVP